MTLGPSAALIRTGPVHSRREHAKIRAFSASRPKALVWGADSRDRRRKLRCRALSLDVGARTVGAVRGRWATAHPDYCALRIRSG